MSKRKKYKPKDIARQTLDRGKAPAAQSNKPARAALPPIEPKSLLWLLVAPLLLTLWAYWPTLAWMEDQWRNEPDYSHGYLVIPLAILLLYLRKSTFPVAFISRGWGGVLLLILAIGMRVVGRMAYMDFLDGWSIVPWMGGLVWLLAGRRVLWWALPAIAFLIMLTPMPFRAESLLSFKLQGIATTLSVGFLQILGLAAIPDGNTIWLGEQQMMVEEACSGLRIFVGMIAMGFFFAVLAERAWIDRVIILASCIPIAILVNVVRVTCTVMAYHWLPNWASHLAHDLLGIVMIAAGASLLFAVKNYWEALYRPLEITMLQRQLALKAAAEA